MRNWLSTPSNGPGGSREPPSTRRARRRWASASGRRFPDRRRRRRSLCDAGLFRSRDEIVAAFEHVLERTELVHVVAIEALCFDAPEHVAEVDVARARLQVFLNGAATIGEPHLAAEREVERLDEARDAFRIKM